MNNILPEDIEAFLIDAAKEFRAAMADSDYQSAAIAGAQSPDEQGYSYGETK